MRELPMGARVSMEPAGAFVRYRTVAGAGAGRVRELALESFARCENGDAVVSADFDDEVLELAIDPKVDLELDSVQVKLRHAFAADERVLLNGYQSWTDTAERGAWSRMRGLCGVPRGVVARYALDAGGDYGFVEYGAKRGRLHGFTYATFRRGEGMVLLGSLDESGGFTLIRTDAPCGEVLVEPECPARVLPAGRRVALLRLAVVRGVADGCYDRWFALSGISARPVRPLVGYTSWYRHYGDIDEGKLLSDLEGAARFFAGEPDVARAAEDGRLLKLFQIDDGYCKVGDWTDVDERKFPQGLAPLAARIRERGFLPGLWVAPFACERDSRLFRERPEWLLRDGRGEPVPTGCQWSGGFALDTRNVEVRSFVLDVLQTIIREWGFGLVKVDFLYAACMHPHDGLNRGQLMADAMDLVRVGAGDDALVLACGVPLASAFGKADYCRIGCDVGLDWDDTPHMRLLHRERVSTKNSLASTHGRAPLDGRAFGNDPDVFFLRDDTRLCAARRDELLFADADLGSVLLTSDDMGAWSEGDRRRYREAAGILLARIG